MPQDDYTSRISTAPGGIGTLQLGPQAYIDPRDQRYVHDAYQYFLNQQGGQTAAPVVQDPMTGDAQVASQIAAQDRDAGITAASAVRPTTVSDPFLASGAAGGARLPPMDQAGAIAAMTQDPAYSLPGESDPFLASGAAGGARLPTTPIGPRATLPSGDVFATDDPMLQEKMDYTEKSPSWWEEQRDNFISTGQDVGNFFTGLKDKGIDVGRMAGSAIMNMIQPGLGLLAGAKSASGAQQDLVRDQLVDSGVVLDDIGRIVQTGDYNTPQNVMAGYTPGQTGLQIGDIKIGGGTAQHSAAERINTINESLAKYDKYNPDHPDYDPAKAQQLIDRKEALKEFINMGAAEAAGGVRLEDWDPVNKKAGEVIYGTDYFPELGQEEKAPTTVEDIAPDYFLGHSRLTRQKPGDEILTPGTARKVKTITPFNPKRIADSAVKVGKGAQGKVDRTQPTIEEALGIEPTTERAMQEQIAAAEAQEAARVREINAESIREEAAQRDRENAASRAAEERAAANARAAAEAAARASERHRDQPSEPTPTADFYQDPITTGGGGAQGDKGGKIVCTAMYQTTGLEEWKKHIRVWQIFERKYLTPYHEKGYHKLFKPFVKGMHKSSIIKVIGAHVARHRTQDLKHIMFGSKPSWLGRIYRKILEPICYIVGKYAKK